MVTSAFVLLFLDIINMSVASACSCAALTDDGKGHRAKGGRVGPASWTGCPMVFT